ncbi:MAG: septal ring lytic transglycosylase RlpA family protein [Fulvimarina manganoxydans]|uniref:septal ring lytic transglycosylase RlpA family protein n=1 Tax=Fulvimarina manganoxydans TaxID=937218 RepID=UPI0023534A3A|nr:septal ring lytic transglycosylase RlpA family protein [Fulvimarina manganoxydans]MCK5934298.1 septal ring lytic transglycosylase RlpA family protein [Fulvimarina manganoxydans]
MLTGLARTAMTRRRVALAALLGATAFVSGCQDGGISADEFTEISTTVKFDSKTYGVPASPRMTSSRRVPKGGGRAQIGKPYKVKGEWYYPKDEPGYVATGMASWYGPNFHGRLTANGEIYDMHGLSAAHKTFPLPSYALVTNLETGAQIQVRVNDRGPFAHGREIDLSSEAAHLLGFRHSGVANVKVEYVGRAPLEGDDTQMLMASYRPGDGTPGLPEGSMLASAEPTARGLDGTGAMMALSSSSSAPMPGVRPLQSLFQNKPARPLGAPSELAAFGSEERVSGATAALQALGTAEPSRAAQHFNLGTVDRDLMARVSDVVGVESTARAEATTDPDLVSATMIVAPGADPDRVLRRLWDAGFTDAFAERD